MRTAAACPLTEVLMDARSRGRSGAFAFTNGQTTKRVYFKNGNVVFASSDSSAERLGERLVRAGKLTRPELDYACKIRASSNLRLGATLVKMGYLTAEDLDLRLRQQVTSIVHSILEWPTGTYHAEPSAEPLDPDLERSDLSTPKLLLEGVRRVLDPSRVRELLGDRDAVLYHADSAGSIDPNLELTPEEGFVLSRVDGASTATEIASLSPLGEDETLKCIYALVAAGLLELGESPEQSEDDAPKTTTLPPEVVRFRDEMMAKCERSKDSTLYELLDVPTQATKEAIKTSYFGLAKQLHPDRRAGLHLDDPDGALDDLYLRIKAAYEVLSDDAQRRRYDFSLQQGARATHGSARKDGDVAAPRVGFEPLEVARLHFANGERFFHQQRFHEAIEELKNAVRLDDSRAEYHRLLASALARNPKWKKVAEEHYQRALQLNTLDPQAYLDLGELYESSGLLTRARKMYETAIGLDPDNLRAAERLAGLGPGASKGGRLWSLLGRKHGPR